VAAAGWCSCSDFWFIHCQLQASNTQTKPSAERSFTHSLIRRRQSVGRNAAACGWISYFFAIGAPPSEWWLIAGHEWVSRRFCSFVFAPSQFGWSAEINYWFQTHNNTKTHLLDLSRVVVYLLCFRTVCRTETMNIIKYLGLCIIVNL
jgi:hypothetical protein